MITTVLNNSQKRVEMQKRNALFSKAKEKARGILLHWKGRVKLLKGMFVDDSNIEKRKLLH